MKILFLIASSLSAAGCWGTYCAPGKKPMLPLQIPSKTKKNAEARHTVEIYETSYAINKKNIHLKIVFLDNHAVEAYDNDLIVDVGKREKRDGEIHIELERVAGRKGVILTYRINPDYSLTSIARAIDGMRKDLPQGKQQTFKRLK
jgi:hypothetical protein